MSEHERKTPEDVPCAFFNTPAPSLPAPGSDIRVLQDRTVKTQKTPPPPPRPPFRRGVPSAITHPISANYIQPPSVLHHPPVPTHLPEVFQKFRAVCPLFPPLIVQAYLNTGNTIRFSGDIEERSMCGIICVSVCHNNTNIRVLPSYCMGICLSPR